MFKTLKLRVFTDAKSDQKENREEKMYLDSFICSEKQSSVISHREQCTMQSFEKKYKFVCKLRAGLKCK